MNVSFQPQIEAAARRHGLDPRLLEAVAAQETGGPDSDSGRNILGDGGHGHGLFQIDDRYHSFASSASAMDPAANAEYAAGMISGNLRRYGGNVRAALSAYNGGDPNATGTKTRWRDGSVLGYADSVLRHYRRLAGAPDPEPGPAPIEVARANAAEATGKANALLGALLSMSMAALPRIHVPSFSSSQRGLDATGHERDKAGDFSSIEGDDNS